MAQGSMTGRAALGTGAADGVGQGIAQRFAGTGGSVIVADFDETRGRQTTEELRATDGKAEFVHCDVSQRDQVLAAAQACVDRFGAIDVLVNNVYRGHGLHRIED